MFKLYKFICLSRWFSTPARWGLANFNKSLKINKKNKVFGEIASIQTTYILAWNIAIIVCKYIYISWKIKNYIKIKRWFKQPMRNRLSRSLMWFMHRRIFQTCLSMQQVQRCSCQFFPNVSFFWFTSDLRNAFDIVSV